MKKEDVWKNDELIKKLLQGGVVVMPTDTIYGIVGQALNENTVNQIYSLRGRNPKKPCIILIGNVSELKKFSIYLSEKETQVLSSYWPGPVSIILECKSNTFSYLHRGVKTLAFRIPKMKTLRELLLKTGPLIAPSANTEGAPPACTIIEAKKYFPNNIDFYADGGTIVGNPSGVIKLNTDGSTDIIR